MNAVRAWPAILVLVVGTARAQSPAPLLRNSFDEFTDGWLCVGANTRVTVSSQVSYNGKGSLRFEYEVARGKFSALLRPTLSRALAGAGSFRFWANASKPTSMAIILQEKSGARYFSPFALAGGKWQGVDVPVADFLLMDGLGGPPDADGKLDLEDVNAVGVIDLGQMFVGDDKAARLLAVSEGSRVLYLDDFAVLPQRTPGRATAGAEIAVDAFDRPHIAWIGIGGVTLERLGDASTPGAMRASYVQGPGRASGLLKFLRRGQLTGAKKLALSLESTRAATLIVQVEEEGGGKFNTTATIRGGEPADVVLDLAALNPADDSPVKDRAVDPARITRIMLLDTYGFMEMPEIVNNSLMVRDLRALK